MFYGMNGNDNVLQIRLQIVGMLQKQAKREDFINLCEKVENYVLNGVEVPMTPKDPTESALEAITKILDKTRLDSDSGDLKSIIENSAKKENEEDKKEKELIELYKKHRNQRVETENGVFYVCGYSKEFDCLIGGSIENKTDTSISSDDTIDIPHKYYTYIPKDTKFKYSRFTGI